MEAIWRILGPSTTSRPVKLVPKEGTGLRSLPVPTQKDHLTSTAQAYKKQVLQFLILSDLCPFSLPHTINSTCRLLCHHALVSTIDPQLFPQTSWACLEVLMVNGWQGSGLVGPKALVIPFSSQTSE